VGAGAEPLSARSLRPLRYPGTRAGCCGWRGHGREGVNGRQRPPPPPAPSGPGPAMVRLHVKRGDESQFLLETAGGARLAELAPRVARVYNGRLKVQRLCSGTGAASPGGRARSPVRCLRPRRPGGGQPQNWGSLQAGPTPRVRPGRE